MPDEGEPAEQFQRDDRIGQDRRQAERAEVADESGDGEDKKLEADVRQEHDTQADAQQQRSVGGSGGLDHEVLLRGDEGQKGVLRYRSRLKDGRVEFTA